MRFLITNGLQPEALDAPQILRDFIDEMARGLRGDGALPMLPAGFLLRHCAPKNCTVPAFDVGGTNLRSARVAFDASGNVRFENLLRGGMPGAQKPVDTATFYQELCEVIAPNLRDGERFGFCFSYPVTDEGKLLFWTKKIQAPDIPGRNVGADLLNALTLRGHFDISLQILNDTVAALLAAYARTDAAGAAGQVGFILGTGTNTAYAEATEQILKCQPLPPRKLMPINCESGNFTRFPKSTFDLQYEAASGNGKAQWERCISGVHLGSLGTILLRQAAQEGLLPSLADRLNAHTFTHIELDNYCAGTNPDLFNCPSNEAETLRTLLTTLYERAALFAAINIAAAGIRSARARNQTSGTIHVNADGSTFWKTTSIPFAQRVAGHLETLLHPYHYTCTLFRVEEAPLLGAALAALNR